MEDKVICTTKKLIVDKGFKQKYVAKKMGISEKQLSYILCKRKKITCDIIYALCRALDVTPNDLFGIG